MSLNSIMGSAVSGLQTAQTGLRTVSDNVANVDTPGYVRKLVEQKSMFSGGVGLGVSVSQVRLAADRFLQQASLIGAADAGSAGASFGLWDQAQGLFGDPSESTSFFSAMDRVFSAFSTLSAAPTSSAARAGALDQAEQYFQDAATIADQLQSLRDQADARTSADVEKINSLLGQIDSLNADISRAQILSNDATGPQQQQQQLINELSTLIDVKVSPRAQGGITLRASDGLVLAGEGAAQLAYERTGAIGELWVTTPGGQPQLMGGRVTSGELEGLLRMRNDELPDLQARLAELVSQTADQLNQIHNAHSPVPAPATLVGRNTGLDAASAITGFTGQTTVALVDGNGVLNRRVDVDFDAGTLSVDGGAAVAFTPATFVGVLDTAMDPMGDAGFANGVLTLSANGGRGVAVQDLASDPASKTGRGFAAFFGLNDLVRSTGFPHYDTGLNAASAHGFTAGQEITFRMRDGEGVRITDVKVAVPAGATIANLLTALNSPTTGVGTYGSFALDAYGQLAFTAPVGTGRTLTVVDDDTTRGVGGPSMSSFFGIGALARGERAGSFGIRVDVAQDPAKLSLAQLNLSAAVGASTLAVGDIRGADALARAGQRVVGFDIAGGAGAVTQKLSDYAAGLSGHVARKAEASESARAAAEAVSAEADARRSSVEGVNLDQELIQLTVYQQAYNASARMIQAVREMYDVLLNMTG
jgi:flagellar hook-associated protein 1 FlgK